MTHDEFINKYNGLSVTNNHGSFKGECVSLAARYAQEVQGVPDGDSALYCIKTGGARDLYEQFGQVGSRTQVYYDRIPYGETRQRGDLVIWGINLGQYGDVAIALDSGKSVFGQLGTPVFKPANIRIETRLPLGYLRRKGAVMAKITKDMENELSIGVTGARPGPAYNYRFSGLEATEANLNSFCQFWRAQSEVPALDAEIADLKKNACSTKERQFLDLRKQI